jgi:tRNA nucleotidyltransferase/poly(A) polymerase
MQNTLEKLSPVIQTVISVPGMDSLREQGKVYLVGGIVRDALLGRESKDIDVVVTGITLPEIVSFLSDCGRCEMVGESFGVLKYQPKGWEGEAIDIALPRTDVKVGDGHRGFDVCTDPFMPIEDDLKRRDITINSIAVDIHTKELIDPYDGLSDLRNGVIRATSHVHFNDDSLRMLRAVAFAARFGFTVEGGTMGLIRASAHEIQHIAPERVCIELDKILMKGEVSIGVDLLNSTGLYYQLFGTEFKETPGHSMHHVVNKPSFYHYLLHPIQSPADFYKKKLRGDLATEKGIRALEMWENRLTLPSRHEMRTLISRMGQLSKEAWNVMEQVDGYADVVREMCEGDMPCGVGGLAVNGADLMATGLRGTAVGHTLRDLLDRVYAGELRNTKEDLLNYLKA